MNIVQENIGQLEAVLRVELREEDYREKVEKELKNLQRKAQVPGFRPGKVPFSMIRKMYGKSVLADEVNKMLVDEVYKYIREKDLNILGNPLPDHQAAEKINWDTQTEFEFSYEIGLAPRVELELNENIEIDYHRIQVPQATLDTYMESIRKQYGKRLSPEVSETGDALFGELVELESPGQEKENGHKNHSSLLTEFVSDEESRKELIGMKVGDSVEIDILKAVGNETEAASMIGVKKEELSQLNPLFRFTLESISRVEPAELNEELFAKALPGEEIKTEEAFRQRISEQLSLQYQVDSDKHFRNEVMKKLLEETKLELPENFLKKWLKEANKEEFSAEQVESEFPGLLDTFRWQLIESHLVTTNKVEVSREEVKDFLGSFMRAQMRQYGQENVEQSLIDGFVNNILSNQDEMKKVYDDLFDKKLLALYKEKLKLNEVEISFDDFVKLVTEKYQADKALAQQ